MHITIRLTQTPIRVEAREKLTIKPDVGIAIGEAPDGLPLVLEVSRQRNVREPILSVLGKSHSEDLPLQVADAIETLQRLVTNQVLKNGISQHEGKQGYTSSRSIGAMLGSSLFAKALGEVGPLASTTSGARVGDFEGDAIAAMTSAGVVMNLDEIQRMMGTAGASRRLFVPTSEGRCRVLQVLADDPPQDQLRRSRSARTKSDERRLIENSSRPIIFERLSRLANVRFGFRDLMGTWHGQPFDALNMGAYREAVRTSDAISWWIPRASLVSSLADVADQLEKDVHSRGRVHGDIKPANMLVGEAGALAIDSLDIEAGRSATVCTPSWAAPEQVTVRPVSPATDVYALGLVLARSLDAVVFGEERTFVVPTGGNATRRMNVLHDAQVFIDPTSGLSLAETPMKAYASFIARCISFDPANRPRTAARFASELRDLLVRYPLPEDREASWFRVGWLAGALHRSVDLLGAAQPAWVIGDGGRFN